MTPSQTYPAYELKINTQSCEKSNPGLPGPPGRDGYPGIFLIIKSDLTVKMGIMEMMEFQERMHKMSR
ncbi:unnamed protein product [Meloidogyne enterolobii]|uniref:Uncharacterized protein n=1 Tax=Meloidogyne enterolobii TaxID=390850 RepID=A0ACB1A3D1_MELEN